MQPRWALCLGVSHRLQASKVQAGQNPLPGKTSAVGRSPFLVVVRLRTLVLYRLRARGHPRSLPRGQLVHAGLVKVST